MYEELASPPKDQTKVLQDLSQGPVFQEDVRHPSLRSATCQSEIPHPWSGCGADQCPRESLRIDPPALPTKVRETFQCGISEPSPHPAVEPAYTTDRMLQRRECIRNDRERKRRTSHPLTRHSDNQAPELARQRFLQGQGK